MKIAWQYKKYLEGDNANNASALADWAHSFDLNKYIEANALDATTITYADLEKFPKTIDATISDAEKKFRKIYLDLNDKINSMNTYAWLCSAIITNLTFLLLVIQFDV
jgi:hypothetical protein